MDFNRFSTGPTSRDWAMLDKMTSLARISAQILGKRERIRS